jgi:hypothetical protein
VNASLLQGFTLGAKTFLYSLRWEGFHFRDANLSRLFLFLGGLTSMESKWPSGQAVLFRHDGSESMEENIARFACRCFLYLASTFAQQPGKVQMLGILVDNGAHYDVGHIWSDIYIYICLHMGIYGHIWSYMVIYGHIWSYMVIYGHIRSYMVIWSYNNIWWYCMWLVGGFKYTLCIQQETAV